MPRLTMFLGALLTIGSFCGCDHVFLDHPIGSPLRKEEGRKLDGTWYIPSAKQHATSSTLQLKYVSDGRLVMARLQWNEKQDRFEAIDSTLMLTRLGDHSYCLFDKILDEGAQGHWFFRFHHDARKGELRLWSPSPEAFASVVRSGRLSGTVKQDKRSMTVRITATPAELQEFFSKPEADELFENPQNEVFARRLEGWNK